MYEEKKNSQIKRIIIQCQINNTNQEDHGKERKNKKSTNNFH